MFKLLILRFKLLILLISVAAPFLLICYILAGADVVCVLTLILMVILIVPWLLADKLIISALWAKKFTKEQALLLQIANHYSYLLNIKMPALYVYEGDLPNCMVLTGSFGKSILIEKNVLKSFSKSELEALIVYGLVSLKVKDIHSLTFLTYLLYLINSSYEALINRLLPRKRPRIIRVFGYIGYLIQNFFIELMVSWLKPLKLEQKTDSETSDILKDNTILEITLRKIYQAGEGCINNRRWFPVLVVDSTIKERNWDIFSKDQFAQRVDEISKKNYGVKLCNEK